MQNIQAFAGVFFAGLKCRDFLYISAFWTDCMPAAGMNFFSLKIIRLYIKATKNKDHNKNKNKNRKTV